MKKKYNKGGQGYAAREDESLGMRTGAERTKRQSMRDRRDESYGAFGNRPNQRINRGSGGVGSKGYGKTNKSDATAMAKEDMGTTAAEGMIKALVEKAPDITTKKHDITEITIEKVNGEDGQNYEIKKKTVKQDKAKGGVASFARGGTMNYDVGGTAEEHKAAKTSSATQEVTRRQFKKALNDLTEAVDEEDKKNKKYIKENITTPIKIKATRLLTKVLGKSKEIVRGERGPGKPSTPQNNAKGGVASYRRGGVEAADKEGSRLSISMERQEDAGYSPSEADFDQQHRLAEEGIMEVGADVKIIQGHNSRASLGETEGVRGTGAMVKGTKFRGSF